MSDTADNDPATDSIRKATVTVPASVKLHRAHLKLSGLVVISIILLAIVGGVVYYFIKPDVLKAKTNSVATPKIVTIQQAALNSDQQVANGNYATAQATLQTEIANAKTPEDKQVLQSQQVTNAFNAKNYPDAEKYAMAAYKTKQTYGAAHNLSVAASRNGDSATAKIYLQKAIDMVDRTKPYSDIILQDYQTEQSELGK